MLPLGKRPTSCEPLPRGLLATSPPVSHRSWHCRSCFRPPPLQSCTSSSGALVHPTGTRGNKRRPTGRLGRADVAGATGNTLGTCTLAPCGKHNLICPSLGRDAGATKASSNSICSRTYVDSSACVWPNPSRSKATFHRPPCKTVLIAVYMQSKNSLMLNSPPSDLALFAWYVFRNISLYL